MLVGAGAIEGGLGIYRAKGGIDALQRGEYLDAAGYFGEATPRHVSAMARKLLDDNLLFKFQQLAVAPRTREEVEDIRRLRASGLRVPARDRR